MIPRRARTQATVHGASSSRKTSSQGGAMTIPMAGSRPPLQVGERAPDFSLPLVSEAGTVSLKDYLGRTPVLLVLLRYIW